MVYIEKGIDMEERKFIAIFGLTGLILLCIGVSLPLLLDNLMIGLIVGVILGCSGIILLLFLIPLFRDSR